LPPPRKEHADRKVDWFIARRPGERKKMKEGSAELETEQIKASVRAKVEHPFLYLKRIFGYAKVRYRGLAKNRNRLLVLAAFFNLIRSQRLLA
jgi:IS5 family transposase